MKRLISGLLFVALLPAQNPNTAVYPGAVATDSDLLVASPLATTTLASGIDSSTLTIPLTSGALFRNYQIIAIENERIKVCTVVGATATACSGGRGFDGTVAVSHLATRTVTGVVPSYMLNQHAAEIKAIETALGVGLANVQAVSGKDQASGYAGLTVGTKLNTAQGQEVWAVADLSDATAKSGNGTVLASTTGTQTSGRCVEIDANGNHIAAAAGCATGGAPTNATYITKAAEAGLSAEQSLGALTTGLLMNTVAASVGTLSTAIAGTDFVGGQAMLTTAGYPVVVGASTGLVTQTAILGSAVGGTGNGFTAFTGPTTSAKTFTLPNASATVLTSNAAVTPAQGGTGASTTATAGRYLKGDGTNWGTSSGPASGTGACTNQFATALNGDAAPTCTTATLASAQFANQGTTTTVLHGNASGNPAFSAVATADVVAALKTSQFTFTFFDLAADLPATLDIPTIYPNRARAITITEVWCEADVANGAVINLQRDDGSPANILSSDLTCTTTGASSTSFTSGETAIAVGHNVDHITVSVEAKLRRLNVAVTFTIN